MNFEQYITNDYSPIPIHMTVSEVKLLFKNLPFTHFPIVEESRLVGMLAQADILYLPKDDKELREIPHFFQFYVTKDTPVKSKA